MKAKQRSADQKPNAWIVNPTDRGRKSIKKENRVYLKDDSSFEIELFNPLKESVLADIKVNGKSVSSAGLVLRPGERFYLDCFIDDKKKFVFKTYFVENTDVSKEAIELNGSVEVFFYKEETLTIKNWQQKFQPVIEKHYHHYSYPYYYPWTSWYNAGIVNYPVNSTVTLNSNLNLWNNSLTPINSSGTYTCQSGSLSVGSTNNAFFSNGSLDVGTSTYTSSIETGRIEKGESSSQSFSVVDMEFESHCLSSIIYHLLPESQKPIETKEIKCFCSECGKKAKDKDKFCSGCGTKL